MTVPHSPGTVADALALLARVMPLASCTDAEPLVTALGDGARDVLGVADAAVVDAAEAEEEAAALRESGLEVAVLTLEGGDVPRALVVAGSAEVLRTAETAQLARAVAAVAAAALAQHAELGERRRSAELQGGLARAAHTLHGSLDLSTLLTRIAREAARVVEADAAVVARLTDEELAVEAVHALAPELIGWRMPAGDGVPGRALAAGETVLADDQAEFADAPPGSPWVDVGAAIAVPVHWGGRLHGVLSALWLRPAAPDQAQVDALDAFADLAGVAFANASAHTGLALSLRTDALTGCLNHAALHDGLRREVERAERGTGGVLSLILLDLEQLRDADEEHGRLVADEILRRAGHALRSTTRPYDLAARYGGTEFALVTVEADEQQACEIAARAVTRLATALDDLAEPGAANATAGVAQWWPGMTAGDLVARADRALMYGRRSGRRGEVLTEADLPASFAPGRGRRRERRLPPPASATPAWSPAADDTAEPMRARARQLALASALGVELAGLSGVDAVLETTTAALQDAFGYARAGIDEGEAARRDDLLGELLASVARDPGHEPASGHRLTVPIRRDGAPWGTLWVEREEELGDDDRRLLETVAAHAGAAVSAAARREALERACLAAARALAGAVAGGGPPPPGAVGRALTAGRRLGMQGKPLIDLALAALLEEAGGAGEAAGGPLAGAAELRRRADERWDEQGDAIPLGARVLAAVRGGEEALGGGAGTRFDPAVVAALEGTAG